MPAATPSTPLPVDLDIDGPAAPPRSNGELVFTAPWEGRAFGLVLALVDAGVVSYEEFRQRLIDRIAAWEAEPPAGEAFSYYRCWFEALEQVVDAHALVQEADVAERAAELSRRPAGHDHVHLHDHDDGPSDR